jgi:CBS domain-containing protein
LKAVHTSANTKSVDDTTEHPSRLELRTEKARNLARTELRSVAPGTPLRDALAQMRADHGDAVLVTSDGRLLGILTERDVLMRILARQVDQSRPIDDFMTASPHTLAADATLVDALRAMESGHYRNLPLIDDAGQVIGLLRQQDLLEYVAEAFPQEILNLPPRPHQFMEGPEGA